jgi:IS30 family transposase
MRQGRRYGLSAEQKADIWRRWKAGESLHEIGRAFGKDHGSIQFLLSQHGGIAPAARHRSQRTLTLAEREDISRGIASGSSIREIARGLQRAASTVSREVARHGGRPLYRASEADLRAWKSALRPKGCLLANHRKLRLIVASKLVLDWSPEQISGWLKRRYPINESMRVSHETIYRSLFIQARGVLKKELMQHLRSKRSIRRSVYAQAGDSPEVRSSMPSPSVKGLQRLKIVPSPVIGREICSAAPATVTSQPWWNDTRGLPSWSKCPAKTQRPSSPR